MSSKFEEDPVGTDTAEGSHRAVLQWSKVYQASTKKKKKKHQINPQQAALHILQSVTKQPEKASRIKEEHQDY